MTCNAETMGKCIYVVPSEHAIIVLNVVMFAKFALNNGLKFNRFLWCF